MGSIRVGWKKSSKCSSIPPLSNISHKLIWAPFNKLV